MTTWVAIDRSFVSYTPDVDGRWMIGLVVYFTVRLRDCVLCYLPYHTPAFMRADYSRHVEYSTKERRHHTEAAVLFCSVLSLRHRRHNFS